MGNRYQFKTFEQWCLENNRQDILDLWDYDKNEKTPSKVPAGTKIKYYFKCPKSIHESESRRLLTITESPDHNLICTQCAYNNPPDLVGKQFGELTVVEYDKERSEESKMPYWICKCSCGQIVSACQYKLLSGKKKTCRGAVGHRRPKEEIKKIDELRRTPEYYQFRKGVIKKDKGKCIISGSTQNIEVHHIYSFAFFPNSRFDINCGVCISKKYHSSAVKGSFHDVYGKINNTPEEFEEYVNNKRHELGITEHFDVYKYMNDFDSDTLEIDSTMLDF